MSQLDDRVEQALKDDHLRGALRFTTERLYDARGNAVAELDLHAAEGIALGTFDDLRKRAREVKAHTISHLDVYLERAAGAIEAAGGTVHWAVSAGDVVAVVEQICRRRGARSLVKSKSMATEEVHLNRALEEQGVEVVESDLGEYIVQLAKETPSHLVIPAIHKTRRQIADLFSGVAGKEIPTDTPSLTAFARAVLREKFLTADIGVTGANFVVADTGTLCMVTNEGNGRLTSSVPPVQIAIVGIEKLIPSLDDLAVMLSLLPRSATGQKITTYINLITGPKRPSDPDGPEELHVIFMDNGRTNVLGTEFEEALYCIRCGACLNVCPVYRNIGGHAYGGVYSGPIGAVIMPLLGGFDNWGELPQASSLCGACWEVCPVGIHLHDHLVNLRAKTVEEGRVHWFERLVFKLWMGAWRHPWAYRLMGRLAYWGMRPFVRRGPGGREVVEKLPFPISGWTGTRNFPVAARRSFRDRWTQLQGGAER
jgi:L-lactate dehydrogenase complex protein LldF